LEKSILIDSHRFARPKQKLVLLQFCFTFIAVMWVALEQNLLYDGRARMVMGYSCFAMQHQPID